MHRARSEEPIPGWVACSISSRRPERMRSLPATAVVTIVPADYSKCPETRSARREDAFNQRKPQKNTARRLFLFFIKSGHMLLFDMVNFVR